jgi:hypothetical protein
VKVLRISFFPNFLMSDWHKTSRPLGMEAFRNIWKWKYDLLSYYHWFTVLDLVFLYDPVQDLFFKWLILLDTYGCATQFYFALLLIVRWKKTMFCTCRTTLLYVSLLTLDKIKSFSFQKQYKGNESFLLLLTKAMGLI